MINDDRNEVINKNKRKISLFLYNKFILSDVKQINYFSAKIELN